MTMPAGVPRQRISIAGRFRVVARITAMLGLLAACLPLHMLHSRFSDRSPWPRRFLHGSARIMGVRIKAHGPRPEGGTFYLANHLSWLDIPVLAAVTGTAFVAHDGLAANRWLRWLASHNDTVFVTRHKRASVSTQIDQVRDAISDTGALTLFPEGTTGAGTGLLPFKSALLSALTPLPAGVRVHPVWLDYGIANRAIVWLEEPGFENFIRIAARPGPILTTVHILPELDGDALADRKAMAQAARLAIEEAMQGR